MTVSLTLLIGRASDDNMKIFTALMAATETLNEDIVRDFLGKTREKGDALWNSFKTFQEAAPASEKTFDHFIAATMMPKTV